MHIFVCTHTHFFTYIHSNKQSVDTNSIGGGGGDGEKEGGGGGGEGGGGGGWLPARCQPRELASHYNVLLQVQQLQQVKCSIN